jgi:hypothetical protein
MIANISYKKPKNSGGCTFVISEEVKQIDESEVYKILREMYSLKELNIRDDEILATCWTHIFHNRKKNTKLSILIPLVNRLSNFIKQHEVTKMNISDGVPSKYLPVIYDAAEKNNITIHNDRKTDYRVRQVYDLFKSIINGIMILVIVSIDEVICLSLNEKSKGKSKEIAFFPYPGREKSTLEVANLMAENVELFSSRLWLRDVIKGAPRVLKDHNYRNLSEIVESRVIIRQVGLIWRLLVKILTKSISSTIADHLENVYSLNLKHTIGFSCNGISFREMRSLLTYVWARHCFKNSDYKSVVVGGMHPREQAILLAAAEFDIDRYYVPHSIVTGIEYLPLHDTTFFVSSNIDKEHVNKVYGDNIAAKVVVAGRPYFEYLHSSYEAIRKKKKDKFIAVLATQPLHIPNRLEFVNDIIDVLSTKTMIDEIIIKIHPSETTDVYTQTINSYQNSNKVTLKRSNLFEHLKVGYITVTVTSNVGLESVFFDNMCICYNPFWPNSIEPPYMQSIGVPVLRNKSDVSKLISSLTISEVKEMAAKQKSRAKKEFIPSHSPTEKMAQVISS